jgi:thiamine pyrophosphokinase
MNKTIVFKNNMSIFLNEGTKFSVVPITNLNKLTISGAKWNLNEENIKAGSSKTLRNESVENQIMISCNEGLFSVIY